MATAEGLFEEELELFRQECEGAAQFFFGYMAIHEVARRTPAVLSLLNRNAMFWNTATAGMQMSAVIAMGRVFDQNSPHNIDRLLRLAQADPSIFSKAALGVRKQRSAGTAPSWLPSYLERAYVPGPSDFRRLRAHVKKRRRIYDANYRSLRHKIYAHREAEGAEAQAIFAKASVRELERLLLFLLRLYESLWHLFMNGRKPTLKRLRYSVKASGRLAIPRTSVDGVHQRMIRDAEGALLQAAAQHRLQPTPARRIISRRG